MIEGSQYHPHLLSHLLFVATVCDIVDLRQSAALSEIIAIPENSRGAIAPDSLSRLFKNPLTPLPSRERVG